jgi:two-component system, cell cycle response regulator DivK
MKNQGHLSREERRVMRQNIKNWQVLIVDDKFDNLALAEAALKFHGATIRTAINGLQGLDILKTFAANLILLDLSMPEMTGWEMLEKLKENPDFAAIPVIALTAHAMDGDKEKVLEAGFTGYIPKPFSVATMAADIQAILAKIDTQESSTE